MTAESVHTCALCAGEVRREHTRVTVASRGLPVVVEGHYLKCVQCGEVQFEPGEMDDVLRKAASNARAQSGLLAPEEVKAIRDHLDLKQSEFEQLLGVGEKTVGRWERGTVAQSATADSLLRLLRDVPEAREYLARMRGVSLAVTVTNPEPAYRRFVGLSGYGTYLHHSTMKCALSFGGDVLKNIDVVLPEPFEYPGNDQCVGFSPPNRLDILKVMKEKVA